MNKRRIRILTLKRILPTLFASFFVLGLVALPASASALGTFKVAGTVSGVVDIPAIETNSLGGSVHGCQDQQTSSPELVFQLPAAKVTLGGKSTSVKDVQVTVEVTKDGDTEPIDKSGTSNDAQVVFDLNVGTKTYQWTSTSGSINVKGDSKGGSFTAGLVPSGSLPGGVAAQSGGATGSLKITGSWTSCHAFPN